MDKEVKEQFDIVAKEYDSQRKYLVPCFEDFYNIAAEVVVLQGNSVEILDLGAGTGILSYHIYQKYNYAKCTLVDISEEMLNIARQRFKNLSNINYMVTDYVKCDFQNKYDAVVSALSIHHLTDADKQKVFNKVYDVLKEGGIFVNADQVLGTCEDTEEINRKNWIKRIEGSPLSAEEKNSAYKRMELDKMSALDKNIEMLKNSGFRKVEVFYKYYNFAVIYASK
jgi:tRNA (cmo5U34)-methyltransferase